MERRYNLHGSITPERTNSRLSSFSFIQSLFLAFCLLFASQSGLYGQSFAVIGTGTNSTTSTGSDPIDGYFNSFRYQVVYTAAELTAAGMTPSATITALGFSINGDYAGGNLLGYKIRMAHTSAANSAAHDASVLTEVKSSFNYNPTVTAAGSFDMITFTTNFVWNGTSNILVDICSDGANPYTSPYGQVRTLAASTANGSRYVRADAVGSQCGVSTNTVNTTKPQIRFQYTPAATPTITSISPTSGCPGTNVTITGTNLTGVSAANVKFGGTAVSSIVSNSGTQLVVVTGAGTTGTVTVTTSATATSSQTFTFSSFPPVPGTPTTTNNSATGFTANWTASAGSTSYVLDVSSSSTFASFVTGFNALNVGNVLTYPVTGLTAGTTYYWRVRAVGGCESVNTATQTVITAYCQPAGFTTSSSYWLSNVVTAGGLTNISNATGAGAGGYSNFTATQSCSNSIGVSTSITLSQSSSTGYFFCWIDWNNDFDFADANETIFSYTTFASSYTGTINIPAGTPNGNYRMRVAQQYLGTVINSCDANTYGEYEDYTFSVVTLVACSGPTSPGDAFTWSPALVTGYNADVIANGVGNASASSTQFDVAGYALVSADFKATAASAAPTYALPVSGIVNSAANNGVRYQLASSNLNNSLRLVTATPSGTLSLSNGTTARRIGLLVSSGSGTSTFNAQVNFSDGTSQTFTGNSVADWYGSGYAFAAMGRVVIATNVLEGSATQPGLYDVLLNLSAANYTKTISSILITKTDGAATALNVMGVSLYSSSAAPAAVVCNGQTRVFSLPDIPAGVTGLTYLWQSSPTGAAPWTSTGVTTTTFTTPALTTPGTMYYRCRVQCSGANNAFSSVIALTVNDVASVSAGTLCSGGTTVATALPATNSTYFWSNALGTNQTATISAAGTYTVNVNNNGCISPNSLTIAVTPNNTVALSSAAGTNNQTVCLNGAMTDITYTTTGAIGIGTATGLPTGVTASWNANTITISGSPSEFGTFNYSIPLTGGCGNITASGTITITPLPVCISSFAPANAATNQNANGLNITWTAVSGASSYDVYFGTDAAATNIANGVNQTGVSYSTGTLSASTVYYWKVVPRSCSGEAIGCSIYSFETGASCTAPTFTATPTSINCFGGTGSISISATGGVSPYQYSVDNGVTYQLASTITGLSAASYVVTVKGDDGCQGSTSTIVVVGPSAALAVTASGGGSGCSGSTVALSSAVTGGTAGYTYQWTNAAGLSNATIANPTATIGSFTSHAVTVTDANGCTATSSAVSITNNSPSAPTASNPAAICETQSANLVATSAGNNINWYANPTGGSPLNPSLIASGANYTVTPAATTTYYAEATTASITTQTFNYTGSIVNWTVPAGVTSITVDARGAEGGIQTEANAFGPGKGARIQSNISVTPGQVLKILVGGQGATAGSDEGAGGGGATFVTLNNNTPLVVAGGGGGEGADAAGMNASLTTSGTAANTGGAGGTGGNGGAIFLTGTSYGSGGAGITGNGASACASGNGFAFVNGGNGGISCGGLGSAGGFGGGGGGSSEGGGGGGGYSGGGGADSGTDGGGGGGSYSLSTPLISAATQSGNGSLTITYTLDGCTSAARTSVTVTVNSTPPAPSVSAVTSSFCGTGGTTAVSASGSSGTYTWSSVEGAPSLSATSGSTINATVTQTSAIQVVASNGSCQSAPSTVSIGVYPLPGATMAATPNSFCLGTGTAVNVTSGLAAGNFSSVAIPHAPRTAPASATTLCAAGVGNPAPQGSFGVSYDDGGWASVPIGFTFDFFGTNYTSLNAGTNGNVMFGAFNATSLADYTFTGLPSTTEPFNMVALLAMDNNLGSADGGTVKYWTEGYAPNRRFVISYENVKEFGDTKYSTVQGIFYETTGVIEVHVTSSSNADRVKVVGVNNGDGTIGVQALAQTPAITTPVAYRFTPPANYTTQWYANGVAMGAAGTNVFTQTGLTPTATTTYSIDYTNQTTGCSNDPVNAAVPVTVNTLTLATTPVNGDVIWRGATSTDWNTASNWFAHNGTTYAIATAVPTSTSRTIIPANQTCVLAQPSVNITTAGVAKDVIIETGATLTMTTGTLNVNGNFVNNGTFVAGTGKVAFNAAGTVSGNATTFNDVDLNNGVNFGSSLSTVNGIMTMNTGSWVNTNAPIYGTSSLLKYNTGGIYGRGFEWSTTSGPGYPNDVQISNTTTINYPNTGGAFSANIGLRRDLTVDAGSNLYMDYGTGNASGSLTVGRNVSLAGDLSLGNQIGGDILVGGNWTHTTGNFYPNSRAVFFNGATGNQTITKTGGETFAYVVVNKASGNVILANDVTTSGGLTLTSGLVEVGTNNFVMGASTLSGGSATSYVKTASTGILSRNVGATAATFPVGNTTYNPAILTNNGTADVFSARVIDNVTADGTGVGATTAEAVVKRTWMIEESVTGGTDATLRLYWNGAGEEINAFSAATAFMAHYVAAAGLWDNIGGTVGAGYVETSNNTSFSPYTISSSTTFAPLPVELISLGAQCANDNVIVSWSTASEHNTLNYVVERSADGMSWNEVQTVAAAVNSNTVLDYAIEDAGAARGLKYYRLIQTDQDGVQKIYGPVMANCGSDEDIFMSFPNPSDADITLVFNSKNINGSTTLMVRDAHGRVVRSMALEIQPGTDSILVPDMELTPGVYYLQLEGESFKTPVIKHSLR